MINDIESQLSSQINDIFARYGLIIGIAVLSFVLGFLFKDFISDRHYRNQVNLRLKDKDDRINDLKQIIQERAKKLTVEKSDINLFYLWKRIVKYFKPN